MANGPVDAVSVDVPLLLRLLEYAREDAQTDMDLHTLTERLLQAMNGKSVLTMEDYAAVVPQKMKPTLASLHRYFHGAGGRLVKDADKREYRSLEYLHRYLDPEDKEVAAQKMKTLLPKMNSRSVHQLDQSVPDPLDNKDLPGVIVR